MRFTTKRPEPDKALTVVLTGDGEWEKHVLAGLANKLDGGHLLWWPKLDAPGLRPEERKPRGLGPLLRAVRTVLRLYPDILAGRRCSFLLLIDKEHLPPSASLPDVLEERFPRDAAARVRSSATIRPDVVLTTVEDRPGRLHRICVVALGRGRCLDENIALLLGLRAGREVRADKKAILRALRETGVGHVRELVAQASVEELQEAFPELISALRALVEGQTI